MRVGKKTWDAERKAVLKLIDRAASPVTQQEIRDMLRRAGLHYTPRHVKRLVQELVDEQLIVPAAPKRLARTFSRRGRDAFDEICTYVDNLLSPKDQYLARLHELLAHTADLDRSTSTRLEHALKRNA